MGPRVQRHPLRILGADARRAFMAAQGLAEGPGRAGGGGGLARLIRRMGFVQIDTINVVGRAHDLILATRVSGYAPAMLDRLAGPKRALFEHWTHDASYIPTEFFPHWKHRFERARGRAWARRQLGGDADRVIGQVLGRIRTEGPLRSADFEHVGPRGAGNWWNWKPAKLALDYLWRAGELYIVGRRQFQKVYDLTERAVPRLHALPAPTREEHVDWACTSALERLVYATPTELSRFWQHVDLATARRWVQAGLRAGELIEVEVQAANGLAPFRAIARPGIERHLRAAPEPAPVARLLCPFDPVIRDRARLARLFGFDYRFEAFVPAALRKHGYYVMPLLHGERLIGRVDPKFNRDKELLELRSVRWEPTAPRAGRRRLLEEAAGRLAEAIGAQRVTLAIGKGGPPADRQP